MRYDAAGRSLGELVVAIGVLVTLAAMAIPSGVGFVKEYRLRGASLYLRGLIRDTRSQAVAKNVYVGIVFDEVDGEPELAVHIDGNGNGIRRTDIGSGVNRRLFGPLRLTAVFPGVRYGSPPGGTSPPLPALRIGRSQILSFSPIGSATSGTLFLSNECGTVHAVVVLGATGRVRVLRLRGGRWEPLA